MYLLSSNDLDIRIDIDLYIDVDTYIYIHTHTHSQNKPSCGQWVKRRSSRCPTGGGDSEACWLLCLLSLLSFLLYSSAPLRHEPHSATNPEPGTLNPRTTSPKTPQIMLPVVFSAIFRCRNCAGIFAAVEGKGQGFCFKGVARGCPLMLLQSRGFQISATSLFWPSAFSGLVVLASVARLATRSLCFWSSGSQVLQSSGFSDALVLCSCRSSLVFWSSGPLVPWSSGYDEPESQIGFYGLCVSCSCCFVVF